MPFLRMWVHCPRASNGLLPRRSNLVGYVRWDAQSDRFPPCQTIIPTAFRSQSGLPVNRSTRLGAGPIGASLTYPVTRLTLHLKELNELRLSMVVCRYYFLRAMARIEPLCPISAG